MLIRAVYVAATVLALAHITYGQRVDLTTPRGEAEYLSLEITGQLTTSIPLANQIQADLTAIRLAYPQYASIRVLPAWLPGETLVGMTPEAYAAFKAGTFHGFDSIYASLGTPTVAAHDTSRWLHVQFGKMYHGVRLSELFEPVNGVRYADPNGIIGDGDDIVARANRTYTLSHGFGDCPAGCIYRESWDFTVTDQGVFPGLLPPTPPSGDFNHDGTVDTADYVVLRKDWGTTYNETHYNAWRSDFGSSPLTGGGTAISLVPEPTSIAMLILCMALAPVGSHRHVRR